MLGHHVIFGAYGFWLPNDPRGSWSDFVGCWDLFRHGPATKTDSRRSVAQASHDVSARRVAKSALKYPPVKFTGLQARAVARGFANYVRNSELTVWACSILPDHVHMVLAKHRLAVDSLVVQLKGDATQALVEEDQHPLTPFAKPGERPPKCWARGQWDVRLFTPEDVRRSIAYVEENPPKEDLPRQSWPFVVPDAPTESS